VLVSTVIGSGIFTTTGFMARDLGNVWLILSLWFIGALVSLAGAICYSELGAAMPMAGGEYVYLRHAYSPFIGFLTGWASFTVGFGAAIAASAVSFSSYFLRVVPISQETEFSVNAIALGLVWILTAVHIAGVATGGLVQQILTVLKVGSIIGLMLGAITFGQGNWENLSGEKMGTTPNFGAIMVSFIFVTYAYSGWNAAGYIAGEIMNPGQTIPKAMIGGTLIVGLLYLGLNMIYFYALPITVLAESPVLPVAQKASVALFGPAAAQVVAIILCISIAGAVSAMIWAGPRVYFAMAKDGVIPTFFSRTQGDKEIPRRSILLQSIWATLLILTGTFEQLVIYSGVVIAIFSALAVGAVIVLRVKRPQLLRPYRVSFYPIVPSFYILISLVMVIYTVMERPTESMWAMVTVLLGVPLYLLWGRIQPQTQL
jgi:APA family basic amino acid/polyamine antiporter